ncbi:MAG: hypothetical protein E7012_04845 [Alphaproteobacteria bacterium]|nr:hypothetical protein [Alphaproteobacteria bacterium]
MNKYVITTSILLLSSTSLAQDSCIVRPSCADMGYTKSASDCSGKTTLKCPFDLTKVSCEEKSPVSSDNSSSNKYDFSNLDFEGAYVVISSNSNVSDGYFTFPTDGCFFPGKTSSNLNTYFSDSSSEYPQIKSALLQNYGYICSDKGTRISYSGLFIPYTVKFKSNSECVIGDIYYSDNTCLDIYVASKTPVGVVIDDVNKLIVSLDEYPVNSGFWPSNNSDIANINNSTSTGNDFSGLSNTNILISLAPSYSNNLLKKYCFAKSEAGKLWYVPSIGETIKIINNFDKIQYSIGAVGGTKLFSTYEDRYAYDYDIDYYWTSSECDASYAWALRSGVTPETTKLTKSFNPDNGVDYSAAVRCITSYDGNTENPCTGYNELTKIYEYDACRYSHCTRNGKNLYKLISCCDDYEYDDYNTAEDDAIWYSEYYNDNCWVSECYNAVTGGHNYSVLCDGWL